MCQTDYCHIMHFIICTDEIFNLYRIEVFTTTDDNVFLTVYKKNEAVFVFLCHISRKEPAVCKHFLCRFLIAIIANHNAVTFDCKLADLTFFYFIAVFIHNFHLPAVACFSDTADFMYILHTEMYTTRSDRLGKTIVGIVIVMREDFLPMLDKTLWNRLRTDVHQSPLGKFILIQIYFPGLDGFENILCPRYKKPYDRTFFFRNRI